MIRAEGIAALVVDSGDLHVRLWRSLDWLSDGYPGHILALRQVGSGPWRRGPHAVTTRWRGVRTLHAGRKTPDELLAKTLGTLATPCYCPACRRR